MQRDHCVHPISMWVYIHVYKHLKQTHAKKQQTKVKTTRSTHQSQHTTLQPIATYYILHGCLLYVHKLLEFITRNLSCYEKGRLSTI